MNPNCTKFYSSEQETKIAEFFGWKVVSGSGSRPFTPGDIISDRFLMECKTHKKETKKITIKFAHIQKITNEACSIFKFPLLCVDNGTQNPKNSWITFSDDSVIDLSACDFVDMEYSKSSTQLTFNHEYAMKLLSGMKYFRYTCNGKEMVVMKAETLHEIFGDTV